MPTAPDTTDSGKTEASEARGLFVALVVLFLVAAVLAAGTLFVHESVRLVELVWSHS